MNIRVLIAIVVVLALLAVGIFAAFFKLGSRGQTKEPVAEAPPDSDKDGVPDLVDVPPDGDSMDSNVFPAFGSNPASHARLVVVAEGGIQARSVLKADDIKSLRFARGSFPTTAIPESRMASLVGRIAKDDIPGGTFLQTTMLFEGQQLSFVVPRFKRAVSIRYDELSAVTGLVKPGDLVDVIGVFSVDRRREERERGSPVEFTKVVIQSAKVLAIGQNFGMPAPPPPVDTTGAAAPPPPPPPPPTGITLAVTPREAEALVWAENSGRLRLALRSAGSDAVVSTSGMDRYDIYSPEIRNEGQTVQVFHGSLIAQEAQFEARAPVRRDVPAMGASR